MYLTIKYIKIKMLKKSLIIFIIMLLSACKINEEKQIDYQALGFNQDFEEDAELTMFWYYRYKGKQDFLNGISQNDLLDYYHLSDDLEDFDSIFAYKSYFSDDIYHKFYWAGLAPLYRYSVAIDIVLTSFTFGQYKFRFFYLGEPTDAIDYPYVDIIESNGHFSFVINYKYIDKDFSSVQTRFFELFYVIYHDDDFPYIVYLDNSYIYLMSRSAEFDDSYLSIFKDNQVKLFKK
ncbi:MAG: hypothetical protein WC964_03020 [Acholeplasmataceae bacterium]